MVCDPSSNNITIPQPGPGPSIPGLGLPFSFPKVPFPDVKIPQGIPEDIIDLVERVFALFPAGIKFIPNADALTKGIWDVLASLFNQIAPFLAFYKFIQALLNIILCIIDVICALLNPFALVRAVIKLFKKCLPDFLSLFPWIALILMILALVLLLIALIEYIIELIISYIKQIIENIKVLTRAIQLGGEQEILAAVNKLAYLLCMIEQLFSILLAIQAIFAVIIPLMSIFGKSVCAKGDSCCTEDFCPSFISDSPNGIISQTGRLTYFNKITPDLSTSPFLINLNLSVREELWQLIDTAPGSSSFLDIITPSPEYGFTYWPEGDVYDADANPNKVPYVLDLNIALDPALFGNPSDTAGPRLFNIRNVIVKQKPTTYPKAWDNGIEYTNPVSGAIVLVGGFVYEYDGYSSDGYSAYLISGEQATLQTLISTPADTADSVPPTNDGYNFFDIQYNFKYNHEVLMDKGLITMSCQPELQIETAVFNAEFNETRSVFDRLGDLPDVGTLNPDRTDGTGTLGCLARSLTKFRRNLNEQTALEFSEEAQACLNALKDDAIDFYCRGAGAAADRFKSDFERDPELQFIDQDINVTVRLRDKTGTQIGVNVPPEIGECIAKNITAKATFGNITPFVYDGYGDFISSISSSIAGAGEVRAFIDGEILAQVINRDNDELTEIEDRVLAYEFIDKSTIAYRRDQGDEYVQRFGPPNIAEDN